MTDHLPRLARDELRANASQPSAAGDSDPSAARARGSRGKSGALLLLSAGLIVSLLIASGVPELVEAQTPSNRFFPQTGYGIDHDPFYTYFQQRGGVGAFGYPTSAAFPFLGCTTQFFQRLVMQQCGTGGVGLLNLLDEGLLPYTRMNGSTFPAPDPAVTAGAPGPDDPDYAARVQEFVRSVAPDTFEGERVNFFTTFQGTVSAADAFPSGEVNAALLPLLNLELWGMPTSAPMRDPTNPNFIYQRFQRGIMHYDRGCGCTRGLLLADYLKAMLLGQNVPADLEQQAQGNILLRAVVEGRPLPGTNFVGAFLGVQPPPPSTPTPPPTATPVPPTRTLTPTPVATTSALATMAPSLPLWTSGPYRIYAEAGIHPALTYLQQHDYTWIHDRATTAGTFIIFADVPGAYGVFVPELKVIALNLALASAERQTLGALLVHEGTHLDDYVNRRLNSFNECISSERLAAANEAAYWRGIWGASGKQNPVNSYEVQLNDLVVVQAKYKTEFEDYLKTVYFPQCSRYS